MTADRSRTSDIDRLSEAVHSLRKSLECTICLEFIKEPIKTRCGHSFCKACISEVLQIKKATCPLCQKSLTRRNVSKDDHMQTCIERFIKLVSAIQTDSNIDILSHLKHPRDTRESCSYTDTSDANRPNRKRKPLNKPPVSAQASANSDRQTDKASTSRETVIDCDTSRDDSKLPSQAAITLSDPAAYPLPDKHDDRYCTPDIKVRTWLRSFSGDSTTDVKIVDKTRATKGKVTRSPTPDGNSKSAWGSKTRPGPKSKTSRGRKREVSSEHFNESNTSRAESDTQKSGEKKEIDSSASGLKYDKIHVRVRAKDDKRDKEQGRPSAEESAIDAPDRANLNTSSANWSRVIEFGKEMRDKTKKVKRLNVRTEKNKKPKIVQDVVLSPKSKIDPTRLPANRTIDSSIDRSEINVSDLLEDEASGKQNVAGTNVSISLKRSKTVKDAINSSTSDHSALETSYITLEENKKIRIMNLSNDQVNDILGVNEGDGQNRDATPDLSPRKLTVLTPEKLNERCGKTSVDARSVSHLPAGNRSFETREKSSEVRRRSGEINFPQMRTPENSRLSLKRKLVVSGNRDADSPLLGRLSLAGRSSAGEHVDDYEGATSPEAGGIVASDRLARVRRNVNTQIDEDLSQTEDRRDGTPATSSLRKSKDEGDRGVSRQDERLVSDFAGRPNKSRRLEAPKRDSRVIFVQLGSMNRRRQTKYYYLGRMNRERSLAAEVRDVSVYNMQQSISKSEMLRHVANTSRSLATSPLNDSQEVAIETTQYFAKSLNTSRVAATENPKSSASSTCRVAAASSIDQRTKHSSTNVNTRSSKLNEDKENTRSPETPCEGSGENAFREISCVSSRSSFRLLSPDKDSQLKFLGADSLASECALGRGNPTQRRSELAKPVTNDCFSERGQSLASKKQESSSSENFDKKRKRRVTNKEIFKDEESSDLSDVASNDASSHERDKSSKGIKSDANKRRRLSSVDDAIPDPDERRTPPPVKKYRRIITCPSTDSESLRTVKHARDDDRTDPLRTSITSSVAQSSREDADREERIRSILQNWNREHKEMISSDNIEIIWKKGQESPSSVKTVIRIPREEESAFGQSSRVTNALETEKKVAHSSQKARPAKESQMFESNSIFYSDNLDYIMEEPASKIKTPEKLVRASNNDIINRVLQIDRSSSDARQSQAAVPRGTSQGEKTGGGDYLLQDNFDEIIANVDLPQSEEATIPCSTPARNPDRTPAGEKTPSCPAMTDEPCGATQETPVIASANDIFEQSVYSNVNERPFGASGNSDKENVALCQKTYTIDDDLGGKIKARGKERSLDHGDGTWIGAERHSDDASTQNRNLSGHQSKDSQNDSLMNVTRDQLRLQIFEEDLFGVISSASSKETDVISRDDLRQEASTPKRKKRSDLLDKNMSPREHAEENDVVENTPESKIKKSGNRSIATADSRRNIALSFLTPKSTDWTPISMPNTPAVERIPFCQDAPRGRSDPVVADCANVRAENRKTELATHGVFLPAKQTIGKTLENTRQRPDRETLCVVCSSLTTTQTETVKDFAARYKIKFADRFDPKIVTHVIVNTTGKENVAVSTLKYLQGIAHRKWIVSYRWVEDCVKKQKILDETPYEATTFCDGIFPASRNSRLREKDLFEGFVFVCIGPYDNVTPAEYQDLLLATGATVVDSIKDLDKKEGLKGILIKDGAHDNKVIGKWYRTVKAAPIPIDWIVDCIGRYNLLKLTSYVHYISPEDYYALGYPRDLVEDEECSDDDLLIIK